MKITIDTLVRGRAGKTDQQVTGRVYAMAPRYGYASVIGTDGKQYMIYEPEFVDEPRPIAARRDIPARFR